MSEAAELRKLVKQLQNTSTNEEKVTILQILKKDFQVNEAILRESKAGLAVGKLRTHEAKEVSDLAKEIVKKWKNEVERAKGGPGSKAGAPANGKAGSTRKGSASVTPSNATPAPMSGKSESRTAKGDKAKAGTGNDVRDRCTELLYDGLAFDSGAPSDLIMTRAKAVEAGVFAQFGSANAEYKGKIRSLFVNLKDKGNPGLRESVVSGELLAEKFSKMSSEEMSSEERRAADRKIKEENFFKSLGAGEQEAETEGFQCGRCKQRKCRYRQAQTRSADEPMTTFVTCVNCGNKWKFS
ncbi:transcription factor S-II, central domain-containing protein [Suillus paluster]|uniref:transcription factor S-II, central domain-containing protein n=1 Tax=Suillus paluster TaxID=48578 RepID=UPI001B87C501|nr:transcription factor S-II, central domain-containing protein [Suillus paluster]KAG1734924.1 transcription factor S-II, central domain-containing protein [Suillus paluster]